MSKRFYGVAIAAFTAIMLTRAAGLHAAMVTLTFDDGLSGVYNYALPIFKKYGVPGVAAIITCRIETGNDDYMTWNQVRDLAASGWEVASHSVHHARPIHVPKFYSQEPIHGWARDNCPGPLYQVYYDYALVSGLFDSGKPLTEVYNFQDLKTTNGSFFFDRLIEELHIHPFTEVAPDKLDIRAFSYEREMDESRKELLSKGLTVTTFIAPYNYWTDDVKEASKLYYKNAVTGRGQDNRREKFDPYAISRFNVLKDVTPAALMRIIQENAIDRDGWVVFCLHGIGDNTGWEPWGADKLDKLLAWMKEKGVEVVTIAEGAKRMQEKQGTKKAVRKRPQSTS